MRDDVELLDACFYYPKPGFLKQGEWDEARAAWSRLTRKDLIDCGGRWEERSQSTDSGEAVTAPQARPPFSSNTDRFVMKGQRPDTGDEVFSRKAYEMLEGINARLEAQRDAAEADAAALAKAMAALNECITRGAEDSDWGVAVAVMREALAAHEKRVKV